MSKTKRFTEITHRVGPDAQTEDEPRVYQLLDLETTMFKLVVGELSSPWRGYRQIAMVKDLESGRIFASTTEYYQGVLPRVFEIKEMPPSEYSRVTLRERGEKRPEFKEVQAWVDQIDHVNVKSVGPGDDLGEFVP